MISKESLGKPGKKLVLLCYFNGSLHSTVPHKEIKILYPFRPYNGSFFRRGLPKGLFEWNTETDWTLYRENNSFFWKSFEVRLNEKDNFLPKQTNKQFVLRLTYVVYFLREIASHLIEKFFGEKSHLFFLSIGCFFFNFPEDHTDKNKFSIPFH